MSAGASPRSRTRVARALTACLCACLCASVATPAATLAATPAPASARDASDAPATFSRQDSAEIDRAVRDVCRHDVVLLGEDADHGSGRTLEVKVELVRRLVSRCGFRGIAFESSLYASLELERRLAAGTADEAAVLDAAGQLWFRAAEARPLAGMLLELARAGRLRIGGIDMQPVALPGRYAQAALGEEVAAVLDPARRDACAGEVRRHTRWDYDDASPFDDAAQQRLRACIGAMRAAVDADAAQAAPAIDPRIARSIVALSQYMAMAADGDADARDRAMFDNLMWYRDRWPKGTRIVVWCATVHAAKTLSGVTGYQHPMGEAVHARFGRRAAAIGFTALDGAFGAPGAPPMALPAVPPSSLEAKTLSDAGGDLRYLDRRTLAKAGTIPARAISYRRTHALPWADVLDGLIVLRAERPATPR